MRIVIVTLHQQQDHMWQKEIKNTSTVDAVRVRKNQDTLTEKLQPKEFERKDKKEVGDILRLIHTK